MDECVDLMPRSATPTKSLQMKSQYLENRKTQVKMPITIGRILIVWFIDCVLGKSGQIANPIVVMVDPIPVYMHINLMFVNLLIANAGKTRICN